MSSQSLEDRLTTLTEDLKQTQKLINDLSRTSSQTDNAVPTSDSNDSYLQLGDDIHRSLKEQEADYELLRQDAEDDADQSNWSSLVRTHQHYRDPEQLDIAARVTKLGEDLRIARIRYRQAQLTAKKNTELARRRAREELFAGLRESTETARPSRPKGQENQSKDDLVLNSSNELTASFRHLHSLLSSELERSQFARETLENSTKDLSSLSESYSNLDNLLSSSRSLVTTLISSQKSDTWYLESAFYILCCTIAWLVFRRLLYGPTWWLLYLPLKIVIRCLLIAAQTLIGLFAAAAGALGASNQSTALEGVSESIGSAYASTVTARGKNSIPTYEQGVPMASIRAGAGGHGAKMEDPSSSSQSDTKPAGSNDQVQDPELENANEDGETVLRERRADEPPNPKKRMWEGPTGDGPSKDVPKDEL